MNPVKEIILLTRLRISAVHFVSFFFIILTSLSAFASFLFPAVPFWNRPLVIYLRIY
jgi:hypothetical protein